MCSMQLVSDAFCQMNMTAKQFNQYYDFFHLFTVLLSLSILQFRIGESKQWVPKCDGGARAGADRWSVLVTHLIEGKNISWDT